MQTISRNTYTSNFSQISNALLESAIPAKPQKVLLYLLSKPANWQVRFSDIKHRLGMSTYAVRQALKWLLDHGYAAFDRLKSGHTIWRIFDQAQATDTPQTRVVEPHVENPRVENQHELVTLRKSEILTQTTTPPVSAQLIDTQLAIEKPDVVVSHDEVMDDRPISTPTQTIDDVPHIAPQHQPAAKRALSRLTPAQAKMILAAFTLQCSKTAISNKTGYLIRLVQSVIDGTFSPVQATGTAPVPTLAERIAKEREREREAATRGRMDNQQYFEWLAREYGDTTTDNMKPAGRIGLRKALGW